MHLLVLTLVGVLVSFVMMWLNANLYIWLMPLIAPFFALVTGGTHFLIINGMNRDPRSFVKRFLGLSVGSMMVHLLILIGYTLTHMHNVDEVATAKRFVLLYAAYFFVYLVFETIELIRFVRKPKQE